MTIPNESQTDLIHGMSRAQPGVADKAGRVTEESSAARLIRTRHTQLGPGTTIDDFLTECRAVWRRSIDLRGSLESYESAVTHHILPFFHGTAIRDWDTLLIIAFIKELNGKAAMTGKKTLFRDGRKLTKTAKKRILAILSGICSLAIVNGLLDDNPAKTTDAYSSSMARTRRRTTRQMWAMHGRARSTNARPSPSRSATVS